jgi:hypothetical protein
MRRSTLASLAVTAAVASLPGAALAQADAPTTVPSLELKGAYAFVDSYPPGHSQYAAVVFRTAGELPRRFDGMIRAGGRLDDTGGSVGSVRGAHGKASHCYTFLAKLTDGRIAGPRGGSARIGSRHAVTVSARGTSGDLQESIRVTLRKKRAGDRSGKPLGC